MKLHLPSSLRKAVLACMTVFTGVSTTVATGAVGVGSLIFVCASQAQAAWEDATFTVTGNETTVTAPAGFSEYTVSYKGQPSVSITEYVAQSGTSTIFKANENNDNNDNLVLSKFSVDGSASITLTAGFLRINAVNGTLSGVTNSGEMQLGSSCGVCNQEQLDAEGKAHICWHTLMQKYSKDKIVWIDARPANSIKNGLTKAYTLRPGKEQELQYENVQPYIEQAAEEEDRCVVIFCYAFCNTSDQIYQYLTEEKGEEADIYVLEGGWDTIKAEAPELLKFN